MTDFEKIHSFESLYNAYRKARQGKRWKGAAAKFEVNLLEALNLLYLDGLDHFVKEKLGIKYYGRYMDDFF